MALIILGRILNPFINSKIKEAQRLECVWTLLPALILIKLAIPSISLLYKLDEPFIQSLISYKAIGRQWYWNYNIFDFKFSSLINNEREAYMEPSDNLNIIRTLNTNLSLILPINISSQILVTSSDVLHSWTVPSIGLKIDACPGRLNSIFVCPSNIGVFFGQCREICGANHSFIPISVEVWQPKDFSNFLFSIKLS